MIVRNTLTCSALAALLAVGIAGCQRGEPERTAQRTESSADRAAGTAADRTERAGERAGQTAENATGSAREGMSEMGEKARGAAGRAGQFIDDATVTAKVKTALAKDDTLKATDINVETKDGVVHLSGTVDSPRKVSEAARVAKAVEGVQSVDNKLSVRRDEKG